MSAKVKATAQLVYSIKVFSRLCRQPFCFFLSFFLKVTITHLRGARDLMAATVAGHSLTQSRAEGGRGGSIGRASASRSNGLRDQRFESRPEHNKHL